MTRFGWNSASIERWGVRSSLIALGLAGGGTLLGFGGRLGWLVELTTHFRVQYLWLLAASTIVLAVYNRARLAMAAAALAAANLAVIVPLYWGPAPIAGSRTVRRAVSLNVHWTNRETERTIQFLRNAKADFILLVEVTPEWAKALGALDAEFPYSRSIPHHDSGGIAFYSRVPFEHLQVKHPGGLDQPTMVARVQLAEGPLTVIGTHPVSPSLPKYFGFRNRQLAAVGRLARQQSGPAMLLGDLNITSWSPFFQDLLTVSGLADTRRGFGVLGSWPALPLPLRIPIDHCLVSAEVAVHDRRIGAAIGSDHRAVIVDFTIKDH